MPPETTNQNTNQPTDYAALSRQLLGEQESSQQQENTSEQQFEGWRPDDVARWKAFQAQRIGQVSKPTDPSATEPEAASEEREPVTSTGYDIALPAVARDEQSGWEETVASFAEAAQADRLPLEQAQHLVDLVSHTRAALPRRDPASEDADTARHDLFRYWGSEEAYRKNMGQVWSTTAANPRLRDWLEETGLGNSASVIAAIALLPETRLTKAQAATELQKAMATKEYRAGHKPSVARVALLSQIVHTDAKERLDRIGGAQRERRDSASLARETAAKTERAALQAEARELVNLIDHSTTRAEREAASARFKQIMSRL